MPIAEELIAGLEDAAARAPLPKVRALHLPPLSAAGSKNGEFCALELDDGALGLSYVLLDDTLARLTAAPQRLQLAGADPLALARRAIGAQGVERTLAFAAINAASRSVFQRAGYAPPDAVDSIGGLDPQPGDQVGMVGLFTPLLRQVVAKGAHLTVVELKPELAGEFDGYRVTLDAGELATCNKVLCTSTVLLNGSFSRILASCATAERLALIGPGAGCLPDPLFARGVTLLGGSWIEDGPAFIDALRRGESWSAQARKFAIGREDYPGWATLLARL